MVGLEVVVRQAWWTGGRLGLEVVGWAAALVRGRTSPTGRSTKTGVALDIGCLTKTNLINIVTTWDEIEMQASIYMETKS